MKVNNKLKRIEEEWENVMYFEVQSENKNNYIILIMSIINLFEK